MKKLVAKLSAIALMATLITPLSGPMLAVANTGSITVQVSPLTGRYELRNDVTGQIVLPETSGTQTFGGIPSGDYLLDFKDIDGYQTPADVPFTMTPGLHLNIEGYYTLNNGNPTTGTVAVNVTPATGRYDIRNAVTDAIVIPETTGSQTFGGLPFGDYRVDFKDITGYLTPADIEFTLDAANLTIQANGTYILDTPTAGSLTVNVSPEAGIYEVRNDVTSQIVIPETTGSQTFSGLGFGDYIVDFKDLTGFVTPADAPFTLDATSTAVVVNGVYTLPNPADGLIQIELIDENNQPVTDGSWEVRSCSGSTLNTCTTTYASGNSTEALINVPTGVYYGLFATLTAGYNSVVILSTNPQEVTSANTTTFTVQYTRSNPNDIAQIQVSAVGDQGALGSNVALNPTIRLNGIPMGQTPLTLMVDVTQANTVEFTDTVADFTPPNPNTASYAAGSLTGGDTYTLSGTYTTELARVQISAQDDQNAAITGVPVEVGPTGSRTAYTSDASGLVTADVNVVDFADHEIFCGPVANYTLVNTTNPVLMSALGIPAAGTIASAYYTCTYQADQTGGQVGTVNVNQVGATGTLDLTGPTPAAITTASYTNAASDIGTYTLTNIQIPNGFQLDNVTDGNGDPLDAQTNYAQTLTDGGTITFNVNFSATGGGNVPDMAILALNLTSGTPAEGAPVYYEVTYGNESPTTDADDVVLTIDYDETRVTISDAGSFTDTGSTLTLNAGTVAAAASATLGFAQTFNAGTAGQNVSFTASVTNSNGDANPANNAAQHTDLVDAPFTITKTASQTQVQNGTIYTYTIRVDRISTSGGSIPVTISDSIAPSGTIAGQNGGSVSYRLNTTQINTNVSCSSNEITQGLTCTFTDTPDRFVEVTYEVETSNAGIPVDQNSVVTNTATLSFGTSQLTAQSAVTVAGPTSGGGGGGGGSTSGGGSSSGGGGGYTRLTGEMKLAIEKLVSLDGTHFVNASAPQIGLVVPENKTTTVYTKIRVKNLGQVSATGIRFNPFFETGQSDMTADSITSLTGASLNSRGEIVIDKITVGGSAEFTYTRAIHENGQNSNYAIDGLTLVNFGTSLPIQQNGMTFVGIGESTNTYLFAGQIPQDTVSTQLGQDGAFRFTLRAVQNGGTIQVTLTAQNVSGQDLTNVFINHDYDQALLAITQAIGARDDGQELKWQRAMIRPNETVILHFTAATKEGVSAGTVAHSTTRFLANEPEGAASFSSQFTLTDGKAAKNLRIRLAQTGPAGILALLSILSALAALAFRRSQYASQRRLALAGL